MNIYGSAMEITDEDDAKLYFSLLVRGFMLVGHMSQEEAEELHRCNLGYYVCFYDEETRARVRALFHLPQSPPAWGPQQERLALTYKLASRL